MMTEQVESPISMRLPINKEKKVYRVSRRSLLAADPPRHLRDEAHTLIPQSGLLPRQVADMILPREDRLWILLFACGLSDSRCLVFARICALRCLTFWLVPQPETVAKYLRTGCKALAREAREFLLPILGDAEKAATWAVTVPFFEGDNLDMTLRRWTRVSAPYRAWAAAGAARKAGISGEDQIADLLTVMDTHPSVLALHLAKGQFER
jgi:hypothetical protein